MNDNFSYELIKGKIAELIFELMFRESGKFTTIRFGYEYTVPELAQNRRLIEVKKVLDNIHNAPDFILMTQDKKQVYTVEVKYRSHRNRAEIKMIAEKTLETWNPSWLFIASPDGFFFDSCNTIVNNEGDISPLDSYWIPRQLFNKYLELLNDFEPEAEHHHAS